MGGNVIHPAGPAPLSATVYNVAGAKKTGRMNPRMADDLEVCRAKRAELERKKAERAKMQPG